MTPWRKRESNRRPEICRHEIAANICDNNEVLYVAPDGTIYPKGWTSLVKRCVEMGFSKEMVIDAINEIGHSDENALIDLLLTHKTLPKDAPAGSCSTSRFIPQSDEDADDLNFVNWDGDADVDGREPNSNVSDDEVPTKFFDSFGGTKKARLMEEKMKKRKCYGGGAQRNQSPLDGNRMHLPKHMVGFNLRSDGLRLVKRKLHKLDIGPPFFYYENVMRAPKGVWETFSRHLYDIEPEFEDSKNFCATARKRGYIHNLPVENRSLLPCPPMTIFEAFPRYKKWWPLWDHREKFNCVLTSMSPAKLNDQIHCALASSSDPPSPSVQKDVMRKCKRGNLVWVGKNKVAPLDPDELELLLGYPRDHTRGVGKTKRYQSLGNSFQVDTVAYHLSVLKDMFPNGVNVLSLFTGIGGGEVALHRLGIHMRTVISVEICEDNRRILRAWWDQTQTGTLIEIADVQTLTNEKIASFIDRFGGFDLVIGGSPCNNLAGSNRHNRDGLEGEKSVLFFDYVRILNAVKSTMRKM